MFGKFFLCAYLLSFSTVFSSRNSGQIPCGAQPPWFDFSSDSEIVLMPAPSTDCGVVERKDLTSDRLPIEEPPLSQLIREAEVRGRLEGFERGLLAGREEGVREGLKDGQKIGKELGVIEGEALAFPKGVAQGLKSGEIRGFQMGNQAGREEGISQIKREIVMRLLSLRFLTIDQIATVCDCTPAFITFIMQEVENELSGIELTQRSRRSRERETSALKEESPGPFHPLAASQANDNVSDLDDQRRPPQPLSLSHR
jgi:hypothetical protein